LAWIDRFGCVVITGFALTIIGLGACISLNDDRPPPPPVVVSTTSMPARNHTSTEIVPR